MAQIKDFGAKIGGARKDLWKVRGLMVEDLDDMTTLERKKYIKKDNIWPKINFQELLDSGIPRSVIYWRNEIRKAVKPTFCDKVSEEDYIDGVRTIRDMVEEVREERDILTFSEKAKSGIILDKTHGRYYYAGNYEYIINGNVILRFSNPYNIAVMKAKMDKKNFLMTENQIMEKDFPIVQIAGPYHYELVNNNDSIVKEVARGKHYYYPVSDEIPVKDAEGKYMLLQGNRILYISESKKDCEEQQRSYFALLKENKFQKKERKQKKIWIPPMLASVEMNSSSLRKGHVTGEHLMEFFGIPGGQFGNWLNDKERQLALDYTFDSFCDIATALKIDYKSVDLPHLSKRNGLAIAFGSRGRGDALAHYEPIEEIFNITRIRGAGSLGHEWAHALDHMIGQCYGCDELATDECRRDIPLQLKKILKTMRFNDSGDFTDYYKGSSKFDSTYTKAGRDYWASNCEMFARAFACYLTDKLKELGYRNDYMCGHSETCFFKDEETEIVYYAYPRGEERKHINQAIDELIDFLKEEKLMLPAVKEKPVKSEIFYSCSSDGQMCFA